MDRADEAAALADAELKALLAAGQPGGPALAIGWLSCGTAAAGQGRFAAAQAHFLEACSATPDKDALDASFALQLLGVAALLGEDPLAAREPLQQAFAVRRKSLGGLHPATLASYTALAEAYRTALAELPEESDLRDKPKRSKKAEFLDLIGPEPYKDREWRWRNFLNFIDDVSDDAKHKVHGLRSGDHRLFLAPWLMRGSGSPCK